MTDKKAIKEAEGYLAACVEGIDDYEHELVGRLLAEYRVVSCEVTRLKGIIGLATTTLWQGNDKAALDLLQEEYEPVSEGRGPDFADAYKAAGGDFEDA